MGEFVYKGRSASGEIMKGRLTGASSESVANRLQSIGVIPVDIKQTAEKTEVTVEDLWRRLGGGRPTTKDLGLFCRQMHVITRTGLPLLRGLGGLAETTHNDVLREALIDVMTGLESGRGLSESMAQHPNVFPGLMSSIVEMGETTGTLDKAFMRMYDYLMMEQEIKDRVKSATRYPLTVIIAIAVALGVITVFVIPAFAPLFRSLGDQVPLPTKIIIGTSNFVINHWPWLFGIAAAIWGGITAFLRTAAGRFKWDKWKLDLPIVGVIVRNAALSRITRSLMIALQAGLPMNETLQTVSNSIGNEYLSDKLTVLSTGIERGESLWKTAHSTKLFTPLVLQMIALGEETGSLPELLDEVADHYKREVDYDLDNLSAAIEPLLLVAVGGMVLVLALGIFLPMWDMVKMIR
ncbi:MAG: type II secretion system F family protein [Woeseiaceae bacterium]|nr:type II secretion system F family protein [Woeseiaceae bacterium]